MKNFIKNRSPLFWTLVIGLGLITIMLTFSPNRKEIDPQQLPWNAQVLPDGQVKALGIHTHDDTLEQAMKLYGKDVEIRLFSNKDESDKSLEAYFPIIYIDSIKASLAVILQADDKTLKQLYDRGIETTVTSTGQRQVKLSGTDIPKVLKFPITAVTLIPKKDLTYRAIKMRFGEPKSVIKEKKTQIERWWYPNHALEIIYDPTGPEALQFAPQFVQKP